MTDPLRDPAFPDRPQHPDFWRLSESALLLDGRVNSGQTPGEAGAEFVDWESAKYMIEQRTAFLLRQSGYGDAPAVLHTLMYAAMFSGLVQGIVFEQHGGHCAE